MRQTNGDRMAACGFPFEVKLVRLPRAANGPVSLHPRRAGFYYQIITGRGRGPDARRQNRGAQKAIARRNPPGERINY